MIHPSHLPVYSDCATCGTTTIGRTTWKKRPHPERERMKGDGILPRRGNQCVRCRARDHRREIASAEGRDIRPTVFRGVLLDEWTHLADPSLSFAENCRRIAPRLGMRWRSLERAVLRAGITRRAA